MKHPRKAIPGRSKKCSKCFKVKVLGEFHKRTANSDGYESACKSCLQQRSKAYYQRTKQQKHEYYLKNKDTHAVYYKQYRETHKSELRERHKQYYATNKESLQKAGKYNYTQPAKFAIYGQLTCYSSRETHDGLLEVPCNYCAVWFSPTNGQVSAHCQSAKGHGPIGSQRHMYCSDKCKQDCITFNHRSDSIDPRSTQYVPKTEQEKARKCSVSSKKALLELQCDEVGYHYCEKCQDIIDVELHHTWLIEQYGMEAVNSAGHILLCVGCHITLHAEC